MTDTDMVAKFIAENCRYVPKLKYMHGKSPGTRYTGQFYLAELMYDPGMLDMVCKNFHEQIEKIYPDMKFQIAGREWSAIPLITILPYYFMQKKIEINSFMVRRKRKNYGKNNVIEGRANGYPVVAVDDLCNSTDSFMDVRMVCRAEDIPVSDYIYAVLNKYGKDDQTGRDRADPEAKTLYMVDRDDIRRFTI